MWNGKSMCPKAGAFLFLGDFDNAPGGVDCAV